MKKNILIGITSSIAAYKIYELIRLYKKNDFSVKVIITENAKHFVSPLVIETLTNNKIYCEQFNPREDVEHISLIQWADIMIVAPASANSISKFANAIADNLLSSVFCAFLGTKKPLLIAPAMNNNMLENPIVEKNISILKECGCEIIEPQAGFLACGCEGKGRLADIENIYHISLRQLFQNKENNFKKVIITLGGTKEKIDTVRFLTNASSGKMGQALAINAYYMGYDVKAISTISYKSIYPKTIVETAQEMLEELKKSSFDYLIMNAAIGDFKALKQETHKISKEDIKETFTLELEKNPDVVYEIAKNKLENQKIIGFCLTDNDLINCAQKKLKNKQLDYIIANDVNIALNTDKNKVTIISKSGKIIDIGLDNKDNIAKKILEVVCD